MPMLAYFEERPARSPRRALRLGVGSGGAQVTILDLSLTGALLETSVSMLVGAEFEIDLPQAGPVKTLVAWNSGEFYGREFEDPIAPSALSAALLQGQARPNGTDASINPPAELQDLNAQVERIAWKMEGALKRLTKK